jgi:hypothetical protein
MGNYTEKQLEDIVQGFLKRTLDKSLWTHEAHIVTAIWHLQNYAKEDALCRLRSGIIAYNLSVGGENTGDKGYHETMTVFWWEVIRQFLEKNPGQTYAAACTIFLQSPMADRSFPFEFYSREHLLSALARSVYVVPDKKKIKL